MNRDNEEYLEIKSKLLKDDKIDKVVMDYLHEKIIITPNQDYNYNWMEDPLENFKVNGNIKLCNKIFKVVSYLQNMNKIYELVLKEF